MVHTLILLAQLQTLVVLERPETAAHDIQRLCPMASPQDHARLVKLEHQLADSASAKQPPVGVWGSLGCARALLALNASLDHDGNIRKPIDAAEANDAMDLLLKALAARPTDTVAAGLLAALSQQATAEPTGTKAMLLDDLATALHRAVRSGVTSPAVLRACTRLQISVGDIATARDCSNRALQLGQDSTWHMLRLAQVSAADRDDAGATTLFERAALAAHDSSAMNELLFPFFSEANWARWLAVPDSGRSAWLRDSLFPNKIYQSATYASRLARQLAGSRIGGGRSLAWWCTPEFPLDCALPGPTGEAIIRTAARFSQLWDAVTGEPIALIAFGVRIGDLATGKDKAGRFADVEVSIHTWDEGAHRWGDTTVRRQLRFPAAASPTVFAIGRVVIPTSRGVTSWAIHVSQSEIRRGRAADDRHAPVGSGPVQLSDLLIRFVPPDSARKQGGPEVLAPLGHVRRTTPALLFFQLWSEIARPRLKLVAVLRRVSDGVVENVPTTQDTWDAASKLGLNEFSRTLSISSLLPGSYRLQLLVMDEVSGTMVRRETTLLVD